MSKSTTAGDVLAITNADRDQILDLIESVKTATEERCFDSAANSGLKLALIMERVLAQITEGK